jgi:hypothetical protein
VAFTLKQYVQTDLQAGRKVANTLTALIIGGSIASTQITDEARADQGATAGGDSGEAARRQPAIDDRASGLAGIRLAARWPGHGAGRNPHARSPAGHTAW